MFSDPENNISQFGLTPGMQVADFGSGSGFYSLAAAKAVAPSGQVFSIDIQNGLLQKLKRGADQQKIDNLNIVWADLEHFGGTKLRENSIDAAIVANLFFQIKNKDALCLEVRRVLRPLSRVMVIDWSGSFGGLGPIESDMVKKEDMINLFTNHDFELDREISAGTQHYGLIFRKKK